MNGKPRHSQQRIDFCVGSGALCRGILVVMSEQTNSETWARLLALMEEKMQFGFLEQARFVVQVQFRGTEAHLKVCSQDALDFFSAQVNQQRLMIISRPVVAIDTFQVELVEAEPLK